MAKSDLLKEAIADAKAIRETALANAKLRMEEAFTPKLQSMISNKLQNEIEGDEDEIEGDGVEDLDVAPETEIDVDTEVPEEVPTEVPVDAEMPADVPAEVPVDAEVPTEVPVEEPVEVEDETDIEVEPEIVGDEEEVEEEGMDSLDLESIIRELERDADMDEPVEEPVFENEDKEKKDEDEEEEEEEEEKEELDEEAEKVTKNSKDVTPTLTGEKGPNAGGGQQISPDKGKPFNTEKGGEGKVSTDLKQNSKNAIYEDEGSDEEINLDEILKELEEEEMSDSIPDESNPFKTANAELSERVTKLSKSLKEHRNVIKFLKSKLNEVNLLNAKLLFTSKLFKSHNMNNNQKMKVIESFDRAKSLREVKLVYSTIAESFGAGQLVSKHPVKKEVKKIAEAINSGASKVIASTKPTKIITESIVDEESATRLKQLAGIKPKKEIKK